MSFSIPALGFAFNLSFTIIREIQEDDDRSKHNDESADTTIITEELALPVNHEPREECSAASKQYNDSTGNRAKSEGLVGYIRCRPKRGNTLCSRSTTTPLIDSV